tara:strand:+ start:50 stop:526 length:477 start_codon:yes stop_codon:yes gene_type:complete
MIYEYELTEFEQKICKIGAEMRHDVARSSGVYNAKIGPQSNLETDLLGLGGELCVGKWLNVYPDLTIYARQGGADLISHSGKRIDVKTTKYSTGKLLAKLNTPYKDIDIFVLVTTNFPKFVIRGWATKEQLINSNNIINLGHGEGYGLNQNQLQKKAA